MGGVGHTIAWAEQLTIGLLIDLNWEPTQSNQWKDATRDTIWYISGEESKDFFSALTERLFDLAWARVAKHPGGKGMKKGLGWHATSKLMHHSGKQHQWGQRGALAVAITGGSLDRRKKDCGLLRRTSIMPNMRRSG